MDFKAILSQVTRPYWSPVHPAQFTKPRALPVTGKIVRIGWGTMYPTDIGRFNMIWLLSGVGGTPPDNYERYASLFHLIMQVQHVQLGRFSLIDTAARYPLVEFADRVLAAKHHWCAPVEAALRLHV